MNCNFQAVYACEKEAAWIVDDNMTGKMWASCDKHIAHFLGRVNSVTRIDEDGVEMQRKKATLNELAKSQPGRDSR